MTDRDIDALIEASSLGTSDAKAMIARTPPEVARRCVERSKEIAAQPRMVTCQFGGAPHPINDECQNVEDVAP